MVSYKHIPDDKASEVFELAARLQSKGSAAYSRDELAHAGREVDILPEYIDAAIAEIQKQENLTKIERLEAQKRIGLLRRIGLAVGMAAIVGITLAYNSLAAKSQRVDLAWAQVENQFQRRSDLIPGLLAATEKGAQRQQDLAVTLSAARSAYLAAVSRPEKIAAAEQVASALQQFNVDHLATELSSSQLYVGLQDELSGTENRIATERLRYNQAVANYNASIRVFPVSLIARLFGFREKPWFVAADASVPSLNP